MFTKKLVSIVSLSVLAGVTALATISGTFAWLNRNASINNQSKIAGWSQSAYFGGGTGVDGDPYIINKPVHLYNLAWLQYIGYFNEGQNADGTGAVSSSNQAYFQLDTDLDMSTFSSALPPIGTEKYPFIGNFDGNGHTISSVTVTNDFKETNKHPSVVTSITDAEVVGLFGVVGKMDGQSFTYSSQINEIKDLGILGATIKSSTSNTLIGIAAGYVNAKLDNVAVNDSNLYTKAASEAKTDITNNVSDYSLVGYATDSCKQKVRLRSDDADIPTLENPNTEQGGKEWGGSLNMQDMYAYLRGLDDSATPFSFATAETVDNYADGSSNTSTTSTKTNSSYSNGFGEYYRYEGNKVVEDGKEYASFTFARSSDNVNFGSYNDADDQYICLYGGKNLRGTTASSSYSGGSTNQQSKTVTTYEHYYRIKNGSNYLRCNSGTITNTTSTSSTGINWRWEGNYLKTTINSTTYYLNISNGSLTGNTTKTTQWTYSQNDTNLYATSGGKTYYLDFNSSGSTWSVVSDPTYYYLIYSGTHYLSHSSPVTTYGNVSDTNSNTEPTTNNVRWYYNSTNKYFSATETGTKYYLRRNSSTVQYSTTNSNRFVASAETGNSVSLSNGSYYLRYNNGWSCNTTSSNRVSIAKRTVNPSDPHGISLTEYTSSGSSSSTATYYDTNASYFPLTRDKNNETGQYTGSGKPDEMNTGYVVSGSNLTDSTQGPYGDIRVSYFPMSSLDASLNQSSYDDNKLEVVTRTSVRNLDTGNYTDSGWTRISDEKNAENNSVSEDIQHFATKKNYKNELQLSKYKSSRSQLGTTLANKDAKIYGLHFMDAAISKDRLVEAEWATVLDGKTQVDGEDVGSTYQKYQLPQDSIDFNLKNQGFINFFAGTYFTNNNTFFSLHEVERDANNKITNIREIKKIYAPLTGDPSEDNPYVYSYDGNRPEGYTDDSKLAFDVSWITNPDVVNNAVYYFEIPVNSGEYALGSVSGKNGAYLMYLDIGAGIGNYKDITTTEEINTTINDSEYPVGVDFQVFTAGTSRSAVVGGDTAAIEVDSGNATQSLNYNFESSTLTVKTSSTTDPSLSTEYSEIGITVKKKLSDNTTTNLSFDPPQLYTMKDNRVTEENYNVFTSRVTRAVSETIVITGGKNGLTVQLPTPVASDGFTITGAINYVRQSGPATVNQSTGLVTFSDTGTVTITMTYTESKDNVEEWTTADEAEEDDTVGRIFKYHLRDYDDPNLTVRYVYDGTSKTYTLYVTAVNDTTMYIDNLPLTGYTVIVVVNGDTAHKTTLTSASTSISSITITGSN